MKININNTDKIDLLLVSTQKKCRTRIINHCDILKEIDCLNRDLSLYIAKSNMQGLKVTINAHHNKFAASYNGIPESTYFTIERGVKAWFITSITRKECLNTYRDFHNLHDLRDFIITHVHNNLK